MNVRILGLGVIGALSLWAAKSQATINVANPSFEADARADGDDGGAPADNLITGWTSVRSLDRVFNPTTTQFAGSLDGSNVVFMNGSIIYQNLGAMVSGETYSFDVRYGGRSDGVKIPQFAFLLRPAIDSSTAFVMVHSAGFTEGAPTHPTDLVVSDGQPGVMSTATLSYTATPADNGQQLTIQLQTSDFQLLIDNVKLTTAAVPEPASLGAIGIAGLGLLARRRRA